MRICCVPGRWERGVGLQGWVGAENPGERCLEQVPRLLSLPGRCEGTGKEGAKNSGNEGAETLGNEVPRTPGKGAKDSGNEWSSLALGGGGVDSERMTGGSWRREPGEERRACGDVVPGMA
ncbi:hypothetical protein ACLB2K_041757 [Fragaria x ananassa]